VNTNAKQTCYDCNKWLNTQHFVPSCTISKDCRLINVVLFLFWKITISNINSYRVIVNSLFLFDALSKIPTLKILVTEIICVCSYHALFTFNIGHGSLYIYRSEHYNISELNLVFYHPRDHLLMSKFNTFATMIYEPGWIDAFSIKLIISISVKHNNIL
jgi:hypothetical protein